MAAWSRILAKAKTLWLLGNANTTFFRPVASINDCSRILLPDLDCIHFSVT